MLEVTFCSDKLSLLMSLLLEDLNLTEKTILANLKIKPDVSRDELAFCAKCNEKGSYFVQTKKLKAKRTGWLVGTP